MRLCGSGRMVSVLGAWGRWGGEKKHEVSVLRHQGNERYVELMPVQHSGSCVTSWRWELRVWLCCNTKQKTAQGWEGKWSGHKTETARKSKAKVTGKSWVCFWSAGRTEMIKGGWCSVLGGEDCWMYQSFVSKGWKKETGFAQLCHKLMKDNDNLFTDLIKFGVNLVKK